MALSIKFELAHPGVGMNACAECEVIVLTRKRRTAPATAIASEGV